MLWSRGALHRKRCAGGAAAPCPCHAAPPPPAALVLVWGVERGLRVSSALISPPQCAQRALAAPALQTANRCPTAAFVVLARLAAPAAACLQVLSRQHAEFCTCPHRSRLSFTYPLNQTCALGAPLTTRGHCLWGDAAAFWTSCARAAPRTPPILHLFVGADEPFLREVFVPANGSTKMLPTYQFYQIDQMGLTRFDQV